MRWHHARGRTSLRGATPASLSTPTRPVRSMSLSSHPRLLNVSRHACRLLVSSRHRCSRNYLFSPDQTPHRPTSSPHPTLKPEEHTYHRIFLTPLHPIRPIQST